MADRRESNLILLSASTDGVPVVITGTTAAAPTVVHTHGGGVLDIDRVYAWVCNTDTAVTLDVGAVAYSGTPADPTHVVWKQTIPPLSGAWLALNGKAITNGKSIGFWCSTPSKITVDGYVERMTL